MTTELREREQCTSLLNIQVEKERASLEKERASLKKELGQLIKERDGARQQQQ